MLFNYGKSFFLGRVGICDVWINILLMDFWIHLSINLSSMHFSTKFSLVYQLHEGNLKSQNINENNNSTRWVPNQTCTQVE